MRTLITGLLLALPLVGCVADVRPSADNATVDAAAADAGAAADSQAQAGTPHRALPGTSSVYDSDRPDVGRGVLHLTVRADSIGRVREDTVVVRAAPDDGAAIIARWIHRYGLDWTWEYRLETAERALLRNDVEWSYEENGLPVDSVSPDGAWMRVLHATDAQGEQRYGWVRTAPDTRIEWWTGVLTEQSLFFRNPDSLAVYAEPGGQRVWLDIAGSGEGPDYAMTPLQRRDPWMRVVLTTPSDFCMDPPVVKTDTVWIRYLDDRGRPRVWYYPRGC